MEDSGQWQTRKGRVSLAITYIRKKSLWLSVWTVFVEVYTKRKDKRDGGWVLLGHLLEYSYCMEGLRFQPPFAVAGVGRGLLLSGEGVFQVFLFLSISLNPVLSNNNHNDNNNNINFKKRGLASHLESSGGTPG